MQNNRGSLSKFTAQYQVSKTLRFELKPIGQTVEWIKKHNIIGVENDELIGVDANRAVNYKYAKLLLDEMHRLFIEDALKFDPENENTKAFKEKIIELSTKEESKADDLPAALLKKILDEKANEWIEQYKKEMPSYWQEDISELKTKMEKETDKKQIKNLNRIIEKLKKQCVEPKVFKKSGIEILFGSNEEPMMLLEWLVRKEKIRPTFKYLKQSKSEEVVPKEHIVRYIRDFDNFCTYFTGFNENRANVYDLSGAKATSIMHRVFIQNMQFHFKNIQKWEKIKKTLSGQDYADKSKNHDWKAELKKCEDNLSFSADDVFSPTSFIDFIAQSGIDRYNEIIGGLPEEGGKVKTQGINEFINLSRQQANASRAEFPPLKFLYKQILSKSDKTFIADFEEDVEMFEAIIDFHHKCFSPDDTGKQASVQGFIDGIRGLIAETSDKNRIYVSKDKLNRISQEMANSWNTLDNRLSSELGEKDFDKNKLFSIAQIDNALNAEVDGKIFAPENLKPEYRSASGNILFDFIGKRLNALFSAIEESWEKLDESGVLKGKKLEKDSEQITLIKDFLDNANSFLYFVKDWTIQDEKIPEDTNELWYEILQDFIDRFPITALYNKTRNHVTKKAYSDEKLKINFNNSTLLDGWDRNKESSNYGILFEKDNLYYLGIMTPESNNIFDYEVTGDETPKKKDEKLKVAEKALALNEEQFYRKMNYKLLPGPNKMLPKVFFADSNKDIFNPSSEIIDIKEKKLYAKAEIEKNGIQNLHNYIDFCKKSLFMHKEWSRAFGFSENSFSETKNYKSVDEFYKDVEMQGYKISFDNIKESYINEKVADGKLYLFQIYNKDFSEKKKNPGTDNLHTGYWKFLFSEENLKDIVLKLNGQAEIFFRKASLALTEEKRLKGHHYEELKDKFKYPIIKDRRFTEDKFFFHCPLSMNFKAPSIPGRFNDKINAFLRNNPEVNIIGIDRGEKHLLYYSVIDRDGNIIEQGTLNTVDGFNGKKIDYQHKLKIKEEERDKARKSWSSIENIKELKAGYLSQVVHKLSQLIIKYNAIVVLEDLNMKFKRGRCKVERQVYQKFEKALIEKLNYLVFKDKKEASEAGHYLNAYQLTNQFESFEKLGKQSGILFYTAASYTSSTDPLTGFMKNVYCSYKSIAESARFWKSFDSIVYNPSKDRFEFTYTIGKVLSNAAKKEKDEDKVSKKQWTVCSCVTRSRYIKENKNHKLFNVHEEIKELFNGKIDYSGGSDLRNAISGIEEKDFQEKLIRSFNAIMTMRVSNPMEEQGTNENDFILSPVEPFFDSRKANKKLPENGDANGAYNIARKGICVINKIDSGEKNLSVTKKDWQEYTQSELTVNAQIAKINK